MNVTDEVKRIFGSGRIEKIQWGGDNPDSPWNQWDDKQKLAYAMELANAMNHAATVLQNDYLEYRGRVEVAEQNLENAEKALTIQKSIVQKMVTDQNAERQDFIEQNQALEAKLRRFIALHGDLD